MVCLSMRGRKSVDASTRDRLGRGRQRKREREESRHEQYREWCVCQCKGERASTRVQEIDLGEAIDVRERDILSIVNAHERNK